MEKKTILIVEDEDAIRLTLRDYLKLKDYRVLVASDGVGAIEQLIDNDKVDLILSDYRMDIFGGDYWVRFLEKYCQNIKVIISSGFLRPEFTVSFPVIYKPFDYSELEKKIEFFLNEEND